MSFTVVGTKLGYRGRYLDVVEEECLGPDSQRIDFCVAVVPEWAAVVVTNDKDEVLFVRQYRHPIRTETIEIPGGFINPGEDPITGIVREVREETGVAVSDVISVGAFYPLPGKVLNKMHLFKARTLGGIGATQHDVEEVGMSAFFAHPRDVFKRMQTEGAIVPCPVLASLLLAGYCLG